jgi:hypothetical protein
MCRHSSVRGSYSVFFLISSNRRCVLEIELTEFLALTPGLQPDEVACCLNIFHRCFLLCTKDTVNAEVS